MKTTQTLLKKPLASVVMPVFNCEKYLAEAIVSILDQTLTDFEFIIINDGSTDGSLEIMNKYCQQDSRIHVHKNERNIGVAASLNKGINLAAGDYFVRMDADDISHPNRIRNQITFLEANPHIGFCGTWVKTFGNINSEIWEYPINDELIRCRMLFTNCFAHPSIVCRHDLFIQNGLFYDPSSKSGEDYDLWCRALNVTHAGNLDEVLLNYRIHPNQIGNTNYSEQRLTRRNIYRRLLQKLDVEFSEAELDIHDNLWAFQKSEDSNFIFDAEKWLLKLIQANNTKGVYDKLIFQEEISRRWELVCSNSRISPRNMIKILFSSINVGCKKHFYRFQFLAGWFYKALRKSIHA